MAGKYPGVRASTENSIEIDFIYQNKRCRERIKLKPSAANIKACSRHREAVLHAIATGTFDYEVTFPGSKNIEKFVRNKQTINQYLDHWLKIKKPELKTSTYVDYRKTINNHIIPALGHLDMSRLKRSDVSQWVSSLSCGTKRISNLISPLRTALNDAVQDGLIDVNPLLGWTYKKQEPPKPGDVEPFSKQEQTLILSVLEGQGKNLVQFAFWTGLRTSELTALEWDDIDWINNTAHIQRAETQKAKAPETTKTKAGTRIIKLLPPALEAIKNQKQFTFLEGDRVFHNPRTNTPWTGDQPIRRTLWQPALKKCGVKYRRPYQTRHTFASMMLSAGESISWVSSQLGHSSVLMTAKVYARFIPDSLPDAGNKAVELFTDKNRQKTDKPRTI